MTPDVFARSTTCFQNVDAPAYNSKFPNTIMPWRARDSPTRTRLEVRRNPTAEDDGLDVPFVGRADRTHELEPQGKEQQLLVTTG